MELVVHGVPLNRDLVDPNDKIIVRYLPSGSLIVLDNMKEFIPSKHRLLSDEEPVITQESAPEINFMQGIELDKMWTDEATGKSFKTEAALKGHFTRMANAQPTN